MQSRKEEGHEREHEAPVLRGRQFSPEANAWQDAGIHIPTVFSSKQSLRVLRALEMEQSVRTPLWEAQVISYADDGESINKRVNRKSICWGGGAFRAAKNKATGTCPRAWCCKPESGKHVYLCTSVPVGQSIGLFPELLAETAKASEAEVASVCRTQRPAEVCHSEGMSCLRQHTSALFPGTTHSHPPHQPL